MYPHYTESTIFQQQPMTTRGDPAACKAVCADQGPVPVEGPRLAERAELGAVRRAGAVSALREPLLAGPGGWRLVLGHHRRQQEAQRRDIRVSARDDLAP